MRNMGPRTRLVAIHPVHGYAITPQQDLKTIKRNARERSRVEMVNQGFERLRQTVPSSAVYKKMSKVNIVHHAVEYIHHLIQMLRPSDNDTPDVNVAPGNDFDGAVSNATHNANNKMMMMMVSPSCDSGYLPSPGAVGVDCSPSPQSGQQDFCSPTSSSWVGHRHPASFPTMEHDPQQFFAFQHQKSAAASSPSPQVNGQQFNFPSCPSGSWPSHYGHQQLNALMDNERRLNYNFAYPSSAAKGDVHSNQLRHQNSFGHPQGASATSPAIPSGHHAPGHILPSPNQMSRINNWLHQGSDQIHNQSPAFLAEQSINQQFINQQSINHYSEGQEDDVLDAIVEWQESS